MGFYETTQKLRYVVPYTARPTKGDKIVKVAADRPSNNSVSGQVYEVVSYDETSSGIWLTVETAGAGTARHIYKWKPATTSTTYTTSGFGATVNTSPNCTYVTAGSWYRSNGYPATFVYEPAPEVPTPVWELGKEYVHRRYSDSNITVYHVDESGDASVARHDGHKYVMPAKIRSDYDEVSAPEPVWEVGKRYDKKAPGASITVLYVDDEGSAMVKGLSGYKWVYAKGERASHIEVPYVNLR